MCLIGVVIFSVRDPSAYEGVARWLEDALGCSARDWTAELDVNYAYDPHRGTYYGALLLREIKERRPPDCDKVIGITELDIHAPVLTFIFGEAMVGGVAAIVSAKRLRSEFYGMPPDENLFYSRLRKEVIHELGHAFGLPHCYTHKCVLMASTSVEEIDLKSEEFCPSCKALVETAVKQF